eukprot:m.379458 g.379458  ORF g.379458 m.379458 type:complete len:257 (-) comp20953_c0_seq5:3472-4242(-)
MFMLFSDPMLLFTPTCVSSCIVKCTRFCERVCTVFCFLCQPVKALREGFKATDAGFLMKAEREALTCGATACAVLVREKKLYVAWLGDSQAMLCRKAGPVQLMVPHKPNNEDEKQRIEAAGGVVVWYGAWRVNGVLSVARAIGDKKLKEWVIGDPDVKEFDLDGTEEYLILACDGLWDVMDEDTVHTFITEWRASHDSVEVLQPVSISCLSHGSLNVSRLTISVGSRAQHTAMQESQCPFLASECAGMPCSASMRR